MWYSLVDLIAKVGYTFQGLLGSEHNSSIPDEVIRLVSEEVRRVAKAKCVVVSGAISAHGLREGDLSEGTIGAADPELARITKRLLQVYTLQSSYSVTHCYSYATFFAN